MVIVKINGNLTINAQEITSLSTIYSVKGGLGRTATDAAINAKGRNGGDGTFNIGIIATGTYQAFF